MVTTSFDQMTAQLNIINWTIIPFLLCRLFPNMLMRYPLSHTNQTKGNNILIINLILN